VTAVTGDTASFGLLVFNMGGPRTLDEVRPFLLDVFGDRMVIRFPGGRPLQGIWARLITAARLKKVVGRYEEIGGGSPLVERSETQARAVADRLGGVPVATGMRYGEPSIDGAVARLAEAGCERIVALPLYPHECLATTGTALAAIERALAARGPGAPRLVVVRSFFDGPGYVAALADTVRAALAELDDEERAGCCVLFSAHGVPVRLAASGDPYIDQVKATVAATVAALGDEIADWKLSFQSRAGPVRWVEPSTDGTVAELGAAGQRALLVVPVSFVSDHIETLHELDIELKELALAAGVKRFVRAPAIQEAPAFIDELASQVRRALQEEGA